MTLRHWVPLSIASGMTLTILIAVLWRVEDRMFVREQNLREEIERLRASIDGAQEALRSEVRSGCVPRTRSGADY